MVYPLPFRAQPLPILRNRLGKALVRLWDVKAIEAGVKRNPRFPRPGLYQEHVFDCMNGLRLIISRDYDPDGENKPILHISVSYELEAVAPSLRPHSLRSLEKLIDRTCTSLGIDLDQIAEQGLSDSRVAHHLLFTPEYTRQLCEQLKVPRQYEEQAE